MLGIKKSDRGFFPTVYPAPKFKQLRQEREGGKDRVGGGAGAARLGLIFHFNGGGGGDEG